MNYYEHHIRDYDAATAHLDWDEDMAYTRALRWYYRKEHQLPADVAEVCRLLRAKTKPQRDAVESILAEFFHLEADGWHHDVCDAAIAKFQAGQPEREAKQLNEATRLSKHREERSRLFTILNEAGEHLPWNIGMSELREAAGRVVAQKAVTAAATKPATPATVPATPATATQTPDTRHQTPIPNTGSSKTVNGTQVGSLIPSGQADLAEPATPPATGPYKAPDCPHLEILALWAEVLPAMPQHDPEQWRNARSDHLRTRWREAAVSKKWPDKDAGMRYFRKLFGYIGTSKFLTGRAAVVQGKRPFQIELEWLVNPTNWAKVIEGKYHTED